MTKIIEWFFGDMSSRQENPNGLYKGIIVTILTITIIISIMLSFITKNSIAGIITFIMVAGACFACGGAIGFLFGLPKSNGKSNNVSNGKNETDIHHNDFEDNTNLQEVSDWLTKIIVGLSLIKINTIFSWLENAATNFSNPYKESCIEGYNFDFYAFAYSVIILYFLIGGGLLYLWARTNLSVIFSLMSKQKKLISEKKDLVKTIQELKNENAPAHDMNKSLDESINNISYQISDAFKNATEVIYNSKAIKYKDDLQKGRWGSKSKAGGYIFEANYNSGQSSTIGMHSITLSIRSLDAEKPLNGDVAFFLHDTFRDPIRYTKAINNRAEITITAWEAFVVGARLENGIELELDLNNIKGFPSDFYWA
ncbi:hypothetical protein FLJC2902T_12990 [Flavobacterium limnosediminis JC2902]|uniref:Prokaryotic YEATS domain-containing protein n=1 Tax=Flavobacterium limnosediminis JC2902 TaxID=1341181 RepID=V6SPV2_9FLAO|nr:pYEATS domain-containing protein [Flavobacterium limnosediminis]ESU28708.1 hypothetical protein FLJC2902T_12990 [Flavobacterium limnosediminis JC2902]